MRELSAADICRVAYVDRGLGRLVREADEVLFRHFWTGPSWALDRGAGYRRSIWASEKILSGTTTDGGVCMSQNATCVQALGNGDVVLGGEDGAFVVSKDGSSRLLSSDPIAFFAREPTHEGELVAVSVTARRAGVLNLDKGFRPVLSFESSDGEPLDATAAPDGSFLAVGFCSGTVKLVWNSGARLNLKMSEPSDCLASAEGVVAAASYTAPTKVLVWCAKTGAVLQRFDACTGGFDLANIGGIQMLNPQCLLVWDSRRVLYEAFVENGFIRRLAETNSTGAHIDRGKVCVSPDGTKAVAAGAKAAILVDLRTGYVMRKLDVHYAQVRFTPDGKFVVAAQGKPHAIAYSDISELPYLMVFDASTGALKRQIRMQTTLKQFSVAGSTICGVQRERRNLGRAVVWQFC
eukprot:CAMPEP_0198735346 /NCGR_PEP_ID=MMETSP1475-20131203/58825_1 /TAXON_ID= ORGANISM="Unidentified sp., Strain CCMP1999" /NCGR_SAMPLE_ID=MMETSP1475 /ASSEMBLY_ACC=CAM_ASM_001111 /LENGTH=406 /DNA_ID=CAMNT_0044498995 /DNA_START=112 /DNA_END=1332 /DNA_ORIENTATION=+